MGWSWSDTRAHLKRAFFGGLAASGVETRLLQRLQARGGVAVLNLHRVSPTSHPFWPAMSPPLFEGLLQFLAERFHVCTFAELASAPRHRPRAVLSFDDGYHDFLEHALPLLRRYGMRANQNVVAECVRSGRPPWNVALYDLLEQTPPSQLRRIALPGFHAPRPNGDALSKLRFGLSLSRHLKLRPRAERETILPSLMAQLPAVAPRTRMLSVDELRALRGEVELGAHSFAHDSMAFESDAFLAEDLRRCQAFFADELKAPLTIYAFSNGSFRRSQLRLLAEAGITHILVGDEPATPPGVQPHVTPRMTLSGDSLEQLRLQAVGYRLPF
jgi:peptidoglycan/xylan/chitin deacetylase (PgdA/CDA1 family)